MPQEVIATETRNIKMICSIPNCDNEYEYEVKKYCRKHYMRWKRHGDPNKELIDSNMSLKERILKNIKKVKCINFESLKIHKEDDLICWEWQKCIQSKGYGKIAINDKSY